MITQNVFDSDHFQFYPSLTLSTESEHREELREKGLDYFKVICIRVGES